MNAGYFRIKDMKLCSGSALLLLVIGVAIMLVLFLFYMEALMPFMPSTGNKPVESDPNAYPWEEQHLLKMDGYTTSKRLKTFRAQPNLKDKLFYKADVYDQNEPCGQISLVVYKDGEARASWKGQFKIGDKDYSAAVEQKRGSSIYFNSFRGNAAPLKLYKQNQEIDRSKLYVITQGHFFLRSLEQAESLKGPAYVTAWIDDDYTAEGKVSIPSFMYDRIAEFNWGPVDPTESTPDSTSPSQE